MTKVHFLRLGCTENTLIGIEIKGGRRVGNTTRLVDNAIQLLFEGHKILVADHHFIDAGGKRTDIGHRFLFKQILRRLRFEHPGIRVFHDEHQLTMMINPSDL